MRFERGWPLWPMLLVLSGCQAPVAPMSSPTGLNVPPAQEVLPIPAPSADPSAGPTPAAATPTPAPSALGYANDFETDALGALPPEFVDVATEGTVPDYVYQGNWKVALDSSGQNRVLMHDDLRKQPAVSFLRYRGTALGTPNGQMPVRYFAQVDMRPLNSPYNYPPTGDQGVQFYYLRYDTYVEVVVKPTYLEIWEANQAAPETTQGWTRLWGESMTTNAGDLRRIGALVDENAGTFTAYLDGKPVQTVHSSVIKPQPAYVTLRGIGNQVSFDNLSITPR